MNVVLQKSWTVEQFLAWEEAQEGRFEFDGTRPVAMTGGTFEHDAIQVNLIRALGNRLVGKPGRVHGNSLKIRVMDSIRYPDAYVTCTKVRRGSVLVHEPVVIFGVLSKSTAYTDRTVKNREYAGTGSVRWYVMLEQNEAAGTMFARAGDGEDWVGHIVGADSVISMPEVGIELPIAELYADVDLTSATRDDTDEL